MKYKPRFHILFFIYIFFGGIIIGVLIYIFSFRIGNETELTYKKIVQTKIVDTIIGISDLQSKDFAYPHPGGVKELELKTIKDFDIPLYLESYNNENKIKVGDWISKEKGSRKIQVFSKNEKFTIELKDLVELRQQKGKSESIKWIVVYLIIGVIIMFVPLNTRKKKKSR